MKTTSLVKLMLSCMLVCSGQVIAKRSMRAPLRSPTVDNVVHDQTAGGRSVQGVVNSLSSEAPAIQNCHPELDSGSNPLTAAIQMSAETTDSSVARPDPVASLTARPAVSAEALAKVEAKRVEGNERISRAFTGNQPDFSSPATGANINYGSTAYDLSNDAFYLGSFDPAKDTKEAALVRASANPANKSIQFTGLAQQKIKLNGTDKDPSPLFDGDIQKLTLAGSLPLVVAQDTNGAGLLDVFLITSPDGSTVLSSDGGLKDAATPGTTIKAPPVAVAGSNDARPFILAAVRDGKTEAAVAEFKTPAPVADEARVLANKLKTLRVAGGAGDPDRQLAAIAGDALAKNNDFLNTFQSEIARSVVNGTPALLDVTNSADVKTVIDAVVGDDTKPAIKAAVKALTPTPAHIAGLLDPQVTAAGAITGKAGDAVEVIAQKIIADEKIDVVDLTLNSIAQGAAVVLEGGSAWAVRVGDVDAGAGDVEDKVNEGIGAIKTETDKFTKNLGAKEAAESIQAMPDTVKTALSRVITFDENTENAGITKRVVAAAADAANIFMQPLPKAGNSVVQLAAKVVDAGFINEQLADGGVQTTLKAAAKKNLDSAIAKDVTDQPIVDNTERAGALSVAEASLARGIGTYQLKGEKLDPTKADGSLITVNETTAADLVIVSDTQQGLIGGVLGEVKKTFDAAPKAKASAAVAAVQTDLKDATNSKLKTPFFDTFTKWVKTDGTNDRFTKTITEAAVEAQKTGGADIIGVINNSLKDITVGTVAGIAALLGGTEIKDVADKETVAEAAAQAKKNAGAGDNRQSGSAEAIAAAIGWGIRNTIASNDTNFIKSNYVTPVLEKLFVIADNDNRKTAIGAIKADAGSLNILSSKTLDFFKKGIDDSFARLATEDETKKTLVPVIVDVASRDVTAAEINALAVAEIKPNPVDGPKTTAAQALFQIETLARGAGADAAADKLNTDVFIANDALPDGGLAGLEGALGWAIRKATLNSNDTVIGGLLDDVPTSLKGKTAKNIAKAAITSIETDVQDGSNTDLKKALVAQVRKSLTEGTRVAAETVTNFVSTDLSTAGAVAEASKLVALVTGANIAGKSEKGIVTAAAALKTAEEVAFGKTDSILHKDPIVAGPDSFTVGAISVLNADIAWAFNQATFDAAATAAPWNSALKNDGVNRGFDLLQQGDTKLELKSFADVTKPGNRAFQLNLDSVKDDTSVSVAFSKNHDANSIKKAFIGAAGSDVAMHRDNNLGVFYVGLKDAGRGKATAANDGVEPADDKEGGVVSLLMARIDGTPAALSVKPALLNPTADNLLQAKAPAALEQIVGFSAVAATTDPLRASIFNIRTMHTSTGKDYVILNGGVDTNVDPLKSWVFALPVMPAGNKDVGKLAKKNAAGDAFEVLDASAAVGDAAPTVIRQKDATTPFDAEEIARVVGGDPRYIGGATTDNAIVDMQVVGDTVYVGVAGTRRTDNAAKGWNVESGIFESTALFDANGLIKAWTPWQRIATKDATYGLGVNNKTAQVKLLSTADGQPNIGATTTVQATRVGTSAEVISATGTNRKLTEVLGTANFPHGVTRIFNFDADTPGFKPGEMSMMVAVGDDRVALIQTSAKDASGVLVPTADFTKTIFMRNDPALTEIAPLFAAGLLAAPNDALNNGKGYLFVGGVGGLARLEKAGNGFDAQAGLDKLDGTKGFPGASGTDFNFVKVDAFKDQFVVALNPLQDKNRMVSVGLDNTLVTEDVVAPKSGATTGKDLKTDPTFGDTVVTAYDAVVVYDKDKNSVLLGATADGIRVAGFDKTKLPADPVTKHVQPLGENIFPVQLIYLSPTKINNPLAAVPGKVNSDFGNLYVLGSDSKIYRFTVDAAKAVDQKTVAQTLAKIGTQEFIDLKTHRDGFSTDGGFFFDFAQLSLDNNDLLRVITREGSVQSLTSDLKPSRVDETIGVPVFDTASGGVVIPLLEGGRVIE